MSEPPSSGWTVPPPPEVPSGRRIRPKRVFAGIGVAVACQLLVLGLIIAAVRLSSGSAPVGVMLSIVAEVLLIAVCLGFGIWHITSGDRGIGLGLLIGWALLVVTGAGPCVYVPSGVGSQ